MAKQTIRDLDVAGKKVLVRVDFNVPQTRDGEVSDDRRIKAALPTLKHVLDQGGSLILMTHLGRPSGDPEADRPFKLDKVAKRLESLIGRAVKKVDDTVGEAAQAACAALKAGEIVLLENVRFNKAEKVPKKDEATGQPDAKSVAKHEEFAKQLASFGDIYVNDAFGTSHRDEASMVAVARQFPAEQRALGFLVEKEVQILEQLLGQPKRPMIGIMGGAKVSDKILVIESLLKQVDKLLIGGAMTYTFLKAQGHNIGKSRCELDRLDEARRLLELGKGKIVLPHDHLVSDSIEPTAKTQVVSGNDIPDGWIGIDIGPSTIASYAALIQDAGTVIWNGPMGKFEDEPFRKGTLGVGQAMAASAAITVVGGGETAEAVEQFGLAEKMNHVSTGGGAFLESLEGRKFNSLAVIPDR